MSAPVRTLRPEQSLAEARDQLTRHGHGAMPVVESSSGQLVGIISRRDLDVALHHGFAAAPVRNFMTATVLSVGPAAPLAEIEQLMVIYDIGRVPVVVEGKPIGIITRTDLIRQHYQERTSSLPLFRSVDERLERQLSPRAREALLQVSKSADALGLVAYLVGGAVRDLLLDRTSEDLDVVVEGRTGEAGVAVQLARRIAEEDITVRFEAFEKYQTASLSWPDGFVLDLATARTEFYPRPGANPEVESASIRLDLYRRDFTINALAICLNGPRAWQLIDFFGGAIDLSNRLVRVLHPNSFIEDPTRIFRAVRFALKLGFTIAPQTETFIVRSVSGGLHDLYGGERLRTELLYLLAAPFWLEALLCLDRLQALRCIHPQLHLDNRLRSGLEWLSGISLPLKVPAAQLRLERLLLAVGPEAAWKLPLDGAARQRIEKVRSLCPELPRWADRSAPALHRQLADWSPEAVLLLASLEEEPQREHLLLYLGLREQPRLLNGKDLKELGFKAGPTFRAILEAAFAAQLAGTLQTREEAIDWVRERYL
ncbi:polynucleotide adenylyltransferase region [Gloeobacter kilaueensis JS1]|uniref:Polynucleotide adenylyltransferase region n=2 Tax=Gloeobacter TaxID=33071 RepID=U5QIN8_GLOK1|nr:polynucleotide adenylyltransferase region [Gloeobacter kilaueensis JS1]